MSGSTPLFEALAMPQEPAELMAYYPALVRAEKAALDLQVACLRIASLGTRQRIGELLVQIQTIRFGTENWLMDAAVLRNILQDRVAEEGADD